MSSDTDGKPEQPHRTVKWSPPYRREHVEMPAKLLEIDDDVRVIIIKGQGPSFSVGYDITPVKVERWGQSKVPE